MICLSHFPRLGLSALLTAAMVTATGAATIDSQAFLGGDLIDAALKSRVSCVAREFPPRAEIMRGTPMTELRCTGSSRADAQIFRTEKAMEAQWAAHVSANYQCGAAETHYPFKDIPLQKGNAAQPAQVRICQSHDRSRKVVALETQTADGHFYAIGLPVTLSAMAQTIATLAGWRERQPLPPDFLMPDVPDGSDLTSTDPQAAYYEAARAAETYMAREDYPKAERALDNATRAWQRAYDAEVKEGKALPPVTLTLMRALAISNQGRIGVANAAKRFKDAEDQFAEVDKLLGAIQPLPAHQLYRVMHLINMGELKAAEVLLTPILSHYRDLLKNGGDPRRLEGGVEFDRLLGNRDMLMMQLDVPPSLTERTALEVLDNYKAALYALAEIRMRDDDRQGAISVLKDGMRAIRRDLPSASAAYVNRTWAAAIDDGSPDADLSAAIDKLESASGTLQTIDQRGLPAAVTWLRLAAMRYRSKDIDTGIAEFETARNNLRATSQFVTVEELEPHLAALFQKSQDAETPAAAADLRLRMVDALQLIQGPRVQQAMIDNSLLSGQDALTAATRTRDSLQSAISDRQREINRLLQGGVTSEIDERLRTLRADNEADEKLLAIAEEEIGKAAPAFRMLVRAPTDIKQLQGRLAEGEAVLSFLMGPKQTFGFLIDSDRISVWKTDMSRATGEMLVEKIRVSAAQPDALVGKDGALDLKPFDADSAHQLFEGLFEHVNNLTDGKKQPYTNLIIVSRGALASIPFSLLVTERPDGDQKSWNDVHPGRIPWLIAKAPIHYLPSLQALSYMRSDRPQPVYDKEYLGFGDPRPPVGAPLGSLATECANDFRIMTAADKISAGEELTRVRAGFDANPATRGKSDIFLAGNFTAARINEMSAGKAGAAPLGRYRFLHFSSHAISANVLKCFPEPGIQITPVSPNDSINKLFLSTGEISRLQINAELVILSACSTATGASAGDEPLSGLVNGFLVAGARGVMTTFWDAVDGPARLATEGLFQTLWENPKMTTPEALRKVQLAIMKRGLEPNQHPNLAHPNSWAVFGLIGDGRKSRP